MTGRQALESYVKHNANPCSILMAEVNSVVQVNTDQP